jgi:hypothetical protein
MDAFRLERSSRELKNDHLMSCVQWLRAHPVYRHAGLVFVCENLPGSNGAELAYQMRDVADSTSMCEFGKDNRPGVPKTPEITENMVQRMRRLLNTDALHFASDVSTFGADKLRTDAMIDQLCDQLLAFERVPVGPNSARFKWSGKNGGSGRDDLGVAALMPAYWAEVFYDSPAYYEFRRQTNEYTRWVQ